MGLFAKDAPWIRKIFTPSSAPATRQPFAVSDDIQLTQPYAAAGQTQKTPQWFYQKSWINPGPGLATTIITPSDLAVEDELWRVLMADFVILGSPTADFRFTLELTWSQGGRTIVISEENQFDTLKVDPMVIWPFAKLDAQSVVAGGTIVSPGVPLLLPVSFFGTPATPEQVSVSLRQISAQAATTEIGTINAYVLRNQTGIPHQL